MKLLPFATFLLGMLPAFCRAQETGQQCKLSTLPTITYQGQSIRLNEEAKALLDNVAKQMKQEPNCNIQVMGHGSQIKDGQQLSWDRTSGVIKYLVEKTGISQERIIFSYGEAGDQNEVDLVPTGEAGGKRVPAPHPDLRRTH